MKRVLIASVLKPVDDTRMYEKFATSLSKSGGFEVHVAGQEAPVPNDPSVHFHPLFSFKRLSFSRIWAPWKFAKLCIKVKPDIIIVNTHDLLNVIVLNKILFGTELYYDVRENYYKNILFTDAFPPIVRHVLAPLVRLKEILTRPFIKHYFLAEKSYKKTCGFARGKSTVVENKFQPTPSYATDLTRSNDRTKLLYSGTIALNYGTLEAVDLAVALHKIDPKVELEIIGYAAQEKFLQQLKKKIAPYPFIRLTGGDQRVPHEKIMEAARSANFGLLPYRPNKSTDDCIPTKIYEYMAHLLPMVIAKNRLWEDTCRSSGSAIFIDYRDFDAQQLWDNMQKIEFYPFGVPIDVFWVHEEKKLMEVIKS